MGMLKRTCWRQQYRIPSIIALRFIRMAAELHESGGTPSGGLTAISRGMRGLSASRPLERAGKTVLCVSRGFC
jgi:hypothetical protein